MGAHAQLVFIILCLDFAKIMFYIFVYQSGTHVGSGLHPFKNKFCHAALLSLEMGVGVGVPEATQTSPEYGHLLSF